MKQTTLTSQACLLCRINGNFTLRGYDALVDIRDMSDVRLI